MNMRIVFISSLLVGSVMGAEGQATPADWGLRLRLEIKDPTLQSPVHTIKVEVVNSSDKVVILTDRNSDKGDYRSALRQRLEFQISPEKRTLYTQTAERLEVHSALTEELQPGQSLSIEWEIRDVMIHTLQDYYWDALRFPAKGKYTIKASARLDTNLGAVELTSNAADLIVGGSAEAPKAPVATITAVEPSLREVKLNVGSTAKIEKGDRFWLPPTMVRPLWEFKVEQVGENDCECSVAPQPKEELLAKSDLPRKGDIVVLAPKDEARK